MKDEGSVTGAGVADLERQGLRASGADHGGERPRRRVEKPAASEKSRRTAASGVTVAFFVSEVWRFGRSLEGLRAASRGEEGVEAVALVRRAAVVVELPSPRCRRDRRAVQPEARVGVGDVADHEAARQDRTGEGTDRHVVDLPPEAEEPLVVKARLHVGVTRRERHVRGQGARARHGLASPSRRSSRSLPPSIETSTSAMSSQDR